VLGAVACVRSLYCVQAELFIDILNLVFTAQSRIINVLLFQVEPSQKSIRNHHAAAASNLNQADTVQASQNHKLLLVEFCKYSVLQSKSTDFV
jgi:hypothetical protein